MSSVCGFTGCANPVALRCAKCALPLCAEHAEEVVTDAGPSVFCSRCALYLRAKAQKGAQGEGGCRAD